MGGDNEAARVISLIGGAVAAWPLIARAQQPDGMRRIGVRLNTAENDPQTAVRVAALVRGLEEQGWTLGRNIQIEYRWGAGDSNLYRKYAQELGALAPDVVLVVGGTAVGELQRVTRTVPIVFIGV